MNKILKTAGFTFSVFVLTLLTGCLGDKGNTTQSSGIGTIQVSSGVPYINLDNLNTKITGNGISTGDRNKRIFCNYLIDWDKQPDNSPMIEATLSDIIFWEVKDYTASSTATIADSDPLNNISNDLYITKEINDYGDNIITFKTLTYQVAEGGTASKLNLVEKLPAEGEDENPETRTMMLIFEEGTVNQDASEVIWRSFTLPKEAGIKNIIFQFKSLQRPNGSGISVVKDEKGEIIENAYFINLPYSTGTASTTTE